MASLSEDEYLQQRLDDQIKWYSDKSSYNQMGYKICRWIELVMASGVPVVLLFDISWSKIVASIAGAIIAILTGIQGVYKFHENWIEYRSTSEALKHEKYLFLTRSGVYQDELDPFRLAVQRIESIISHENINWSQMHQDKDDTKSIN